VPSLFVLEQSLGRFIRIRMLSVKEQLGENVDLREYPYLIIVFLKILFYSYVHTMFGSFLPPSPAPSLNHPTSSLFPPTPLLPGRNYFALISSFVEERV
jgi:hypothetical protein